MSIDPHIFRFGIFDLEPKQLLLRRHGRRVRLSGSLFRLLTLLVTRSGQLVTRDEIAAILWTDTLNVDVSNGINTAINRLRGHLGDDPASPKFIETVVGAGYRFVAEVAEVAEVAAATPQPAVSALADPEPNVEQPAIELSDGLPNEQMEEPVHGAVLPLTIEPFRQNSRRWAQLLTLAALAIAISAASVIALRLRPRAVPPAPLTLFAQPLVTVTFNDEDDNVLAAAISPDGASVAYSDRSGVSVHLFEANSDRLIPTPPNFRVDRLAWDAAHSQLLVSGVDNATRQHQAWLLSLLGGPPKMLLGDAGRIAVSWDGREIAFTQKGDTEIWVAEVNGQNARRLLTGGQGEAFPFLLWSPAGNRLLFERSSVGRLSRTGTPLGGSGTPAESLEQQDRWTCESIDPNSGRILDVEENIRFESAYLTQDGRLFYPVNEAYAELKRARLMMVRTDPATGHFLGAASPAGGFDAGVASSISASADGKRVSVVLERRTADVFEAAFNPVGPELAPGIRITHHSAGSLPHAWTPSGDAILFEANRSNSDEIYEQKLANSREDRFSGEMLAHVSGRAAMAEFSPDGKWILFMEFSGRPQHVDAIYRVPEGGGAPTRVATRGPIDEFHCSLSNAGVCILRETVNKKQFVFYALDPVTGMGAELARSPWTPNLLGDWSVSPDGSTVASADHDPQHPGIRFVTLTGPSAGSVSESPVEGFGTLLGTTWAPDGKTLFVQSRTDTGYQLLLADRQGHARLLRESTIPIWAVPSRDGKKLAYPGPTINTNVWVGNASPL